MTDGLVAGFVSDGFAPVREAFVANLEGGADLGASFTATVEGETVVDLWGGWADEAKTRRWARDTIVNVYSITKTMTALTALLLADRGELDFDAPVAKYWPEFAAGGKTAVKVSHLMSHSAGLPIWRETITLQDLYDWDKVTSLLAAQEPLWQPGTAVGYHAVTQGFLVGEVVRRITGRSLGRVFRDEIAAPLGADFHIGLPTEHDARVADLVPMPPDAQVVAEPNEWMVSIQTNPPMNPLDTRTRAWRAAEIPAAGGQGNARSIAEIHVLLANGGIAKGKRLLSEAGCRKALEPQIEGIDLVLGTPTKFGLGFGLSSALFAMPNPNSLFWGGYGGSLVLIDMDARTTVGYAMNKMGPALMGDERSLAMARAFQEVLPA